jgi:glycosyltransferase involved in cell wall biosynthesis
MAAAQADHVAGLARTTDPHQYAFSAWFLGGGGALVDRLAAAGVDARALAFGGARDPLGAMRFARAMRSLRPDIVQLDVGGRARIVLTRLLVGAPLIAYLTAAAGDDEAALPLERFARSADAVVAVSEALARRVSVPAVIVHPGVDIHPQALVREERPVTIATAARLEPVKRIGDLLEAVAAVRSSWPEVRLEIAGTGSSEGELRRRAVSLGLDDAFLGWSDDVVHLHRQWDIFVMPSASEGFGLAALEAMASGLPVISSAVGGLLEIVAPDETGLVFPPGDVQQLTEHLRLLVSDAGLRHRLGQAGRERAQREFSREAADRKMRAVYDGVLAAETTRWRRRPSA